MILNVFDDASAATPTVKSIEIPTVDNGTEFRTLVRVQNNPTVSGDTPVVSVLPLSIIGTSEETSKGVRRVLVKVELPYASLQKCNCESGSYDVDPERSGSLISMHVVLTLPKQAAKDLSGSNETAAGVFTRVALLQYALETLLRPQGSAFGSADFVPLLQESSHTDTAVSYGGNQLSVKLGPDAFNALSPWRRGMALLKPFLTNGTYGIPTLSGAIGN